MKKIITKHLFLGCCLFLLTLSNTLVAQNGKYKKANKHYDNLAYNEASKLYLELAESGFQPIELLKNLADTYYFNGDYRNASKWYHSYFAKSKETNAYIEPMYYLKYAQSLKSTGDNTLSSQFFNTYADKVDLSKQHLKNSLDYLSIISEDYELLPGDLKFIKINAAGSIVYANDILDEYIVFSAANEIGDDLWSGHSYFKLNKALFNEEEGVIGEPEALDIHADANFHVSSAVFTKDGQTMYYTRSNSFNLGKKADDKIIHTKIYRAHLVDGKWTNEEDLSINDNNFSTAHPSLSPDEDKLYFASDNTFLSMGQIDIFVVEIHPDGSLGEPRNLGPDINTKGRESFPFASKNGLFFSSDGHFGIGGYDVFYASFDEEETIEGDLINLGRPVNSPYDDIAFFIGDENSDENYGFVSSNRPSQNPNESNVYSFDQFDATKLNKKKRAPAKQTITGALKDEHGKLPANVEVLLLDKNGQVVDRVFTDENGQYTFKVDCCNHEFKIRVDEKDLESIYDLPITMNDHAGAIFNSAILPVQTKSSDALVKRLIEQVNPIYFDLNKSNINEEAAQKLMKIVQIMEAYPEITLEFGSHTDSRASSTYNLKLSERRATSTKNWIVAKGIDAQRIIGKGYGEFQLVNHCADGIKCTEEEHRLNRRSEFKVIHFDMIEMTNEPDEPQTEAKPVKSKVHIVQKGENLYRISLKYNIRIEKLKALNGLKSDRIVEGQELILKQE